MAQKSPALIHITPGTMTTDWCDTCLLPSVVVVPLHVIGSSGVHRVGTYRKCQECGL